MTVDEAKRKEMVQSLEKAIADEVPFVMLYFQDGNYGYRAADVRQLGVPEGAGHLHQAVVPPRVRPLATV